MSTVVVLVIGSVFVRVKGRNPLMYVKAGKGGVLVISLGVDSRILRSPQMLWHVQVFPVGTEMLVEAGRSEVPVVRLICSVLESTLASYSPK